MKIWAIAVVELAPDPCAGFVFLRRYLQESRTEHDGVVTVAP
jgi:hypothetical protein